MNRSSQCAERRTSEHRSSRAPVARFALLLVLALLVVASPACSGRSSSGKTAVDAGDLPDVCEQYLQVYGACMHRLLPQGAEIADARTTNARASLQRLVGHEQQLRDTCVNGTRKLRACCN